MKRMKGVIARLFIITLAFVLVGQGCIGSGGGTNQQEDITLQIWGVFDDASAYRDIISAYRTLHPNVKIEYRRLRFEEFESELVRAIAENRGPDIFTVHNTWLGGYQDLMTPMPPTVTVTQNVVQGTLRREVRTVRQEKQTLSVRALRERFVEQVGRDVVRNYRATNGSAIEERIWGLPMSVDSLALFYNKDLLDAAGIATPPANWTEFQQNVIALTSYNQTGDVSRSAAALGTSRNVERSTDILTLLMMQNGTEMTDDRGRITLNRTPANMGRETPPGLTALEFYTDFANPTKEVYTWNENFSNSFEAFARGETAFFFGYSYHIPLLRTAAPKLNFSITSVPQIQGGQRVDFANYWVHTVSKTSRQQDWAWDFLLFASDAENVGTYLSAAKKPTALRALIQSQLEDIDLGVFAQQTLTARHWYLGNDAPAMEEALKDAIDGMLQNPQRPIDLLNTAATRISQTF